MTNGTMERTGPWYWFSGVDETDDEMMLSDSREEAIAIGKKTMPGETFYIVEACFSEEDERALENCDLDFAPFAATRNGEFIEP